MRDLGIRRSILAASYRFAKIATLGLGQGLKSYHGWSIQMYEGKDFPGWNRVRRAHPKIGRNSLIFCKSGTDRWCGKTRQLIQHKLLKPHPNECGRKRRLDRATTATKHRT